MELAINKDNAKIKIIARQSRAIFQILNLQTPNPISKFHTSRFHISIFNYEQ